MQISEIKELMDKMTQTGMNVLEIEENGSRLRLERSGAACESTAFIQEVRTVSAMEIPPETDAAAEPQGYLVISPVIGIYFSAPTPDSEAFVKVGSKVETGSPLCIIEAMKLMNEVTSAWDGTILEIMAVNGQRVEFGQPLMRIGGN